MTLIQPRAWTAGSGGGPRIRLSAAHAEWNHVGIALAAMDLGYFATEGLPDVELIAFPENEGELVEREAAQVDLLARGIVDVGIDPRTTFVLEAKDQEKPVCVVAARRKNHAFVLFGQKGLTSIFDLRGQTVVMGQPGGATDVMLRQFLKDSGLEPDEDVPFRYTGGPMHDTAGSAAAFREGRHGPAILSPTAEVEGLKADGFPILADLRELYPSRHDRVTAANEDFVDQHPDLLTSFLRGMIRACRFVLDFENTEQFKDIVLRAGFLTTEREQRSFDDLFVGWQTRGSRDLELPREGIERIVNEGKQAGRLSPGFKVDDVLRLDPLRQAQRALSEVSA